MPPVVACKFYKQLCVPCKRKHGQAQNALENSIFIAFYRI